MTRPRLPYAWDEEQPVRLTALLPLERRYGGYAGPIAHMPEKSMPVGEFLDPFTDEWIVCSLRSYLIRIGWR